MLQKLNKYRKKRSIYLRIAHSPSQKNFKISKIEKINNCNYNKKIQYKKINLIPIFMIQKYIHMFKRFVRKNFKILKNFNVNKQSNKNK